nr:leucine zipper protein 2-like [Cavia porcellus]
MSGKVESADCLNWNPPRGPVPVVTLKITLPAPPQGVPGKKLLCPEIGPGMEKCGGILHRRRYLLFLQLHNKSLKNKLLSGSKLCGIHAEESKKIQAQLKELRYGKKDLLFKAQQLTDLEQKLAVAKNELEKAALDRESQMKAMKETVQLCLTSVFRDQPPPLSLITSNPSQLSGPPRAVAVKIPEARTKSQVPFILIWKLTVSENAAVCTAKGHECDVYLIEGG